jgi:hypothetical protein
MFARLSGSSSAVERQLPKLDVAGSIPVSRSINSLVLISHIVSAKRNYVHHYCEHQARRPLQFHFPGEKEFLVDSKVDELDRRVDS